MKQGIVVGKHRETQNIMGMLVKDIMRCFLNEKGELLQVVEFIVYDTPGPHGYAPRNIDRRWSLATPLDKEMQPFVVAPFEPISEFASSLLRNYRHIRTRVLGWLKQSSAKRADLANCYRRSKKLKVGCHVIFRDARQRKAGGRTPYRLPYTRILYRTGDRACMANRGGYLSERIQAGGPQVTYGKAW